jgi:signal transduction histidine kinase
VRRVDLSTLGTGIAVLVLGVFLYLHSKGTLDLNTGASFALVGGCVLVALIARAMGRPAPSGTVTAERDTLSIAPGLSPETTRASKLGLTVGALLGIGLIVLWLSGVIEFAGRVALAALVVAVALILISAPFWRAIFNRLGAERVARARADERADVAAHLHDSVLQTLALIQKRSDDPEQVGRLARRQERELREWLSDTKPSRPDERLADALRATAADIEDSHGTPIEAVVVGDAELDERLEALVAASREALTNSAKFASDGGPVRLYAEIEKGTAHVFIDDRGPGFDPESIPADRRGVRESIIGRMERHGGRAEIRSDSGDGTEVELTMRAARR